MAVKFGSFGKSAKGAFIKSPKGARGYGPPFPPTCEDCCHCDPNVYYLTSSGFTLPFNYSSISPLKLNKINTMACEYDNRSKRYQNQIYRVELKYISGSKKWQINFEHDTESEEGVVLVARFEYALPGGADPSEYEAGSGEYVFIEGEGEGGSVSIVSGYSPAARATTLCRERTVNSYLPRTITMTVSGIIDWHYFCPFGDCGAAEFYHYFSSLNGTHTLAGNGTGYYARLRAFSWRWKWRCLDTTPPGPWYEWYLPKMGGWTVNLLQDPETKIWTYEWHASFYDYEFPGPVLRGSYTYPESGIYEIGSYSERPQPIDVGSMNIFYAHGDNTPPCAGQPTCEDCYSGVSCSIIGQSDD